MWGPHLAFSLPVCDLYIKLSLVLLTFTFYGWVTWGLMQSSKARVLSVKARIVIILASSVTQSGSLELPSAISVWKLPEATGWTRMQSYVPIKCHRNSEGQIWLKGVCWAEPCPQSQSGTQICPFMAQPPPPTLVVSLLVCGILGDVFGGIGLPRWLSVKESTC